MKSTAQAIRESNISPRLIRAVLRQLNGDAKNSLEDIANHGIDGGFHGFIYHKDTVAFFRRNRKEIVELVESMASELGEDPISVVIGFRCLGGRDLYQGSITEREKVRADYQASVGRCLYGGALSDKDLSHHVANALAWFAGEEVARAFVDDG